MGTEIFAYLFFILLGAGGLYLGMFFWNKKLGKEANNILEKARNQSNKLVSDSEKKAQEILVKAEKEKQFELSKIEKIEIKLQEKEDRIDKKIENLDKLKEENQKKADLVDKMIEEQKLKLSEISNLTQEEAKERLFKAIEIEYQEDIKNFIQKYKSLKIEDMTKEAAEMMAKVLPRVASDSVSEFTVTNVDLPSEDTKGKLIGREGRNISYFEKVTGVELVIDDTPMMVKISSYDPEKRFIAAETLKKLIKDGRINPVYIKKLYEEVESGLDKRLKDKGEETLTNLGLPLMKPDVVKMIGQFYLRYSYGQNLLYHSIEVARISELIANELGLDGMLAKKAGILHDIGKINAQTGQGHSKIGGDILRKYGFEEIVVNVAEGHHNDVPLIHPISRIVSAADAISASRPGARFNTKELFLDRMSTLEKLISSISGTDKVFIMQAGREIIVFAKPDEVDDVGLEKLVKDIGVKIENQLDYPGVIRVMAIRETRVVDYLK